MTLLLLLLFMAFFMAMFGLLGRWRRITLFTMCKRLTGFRAPQPHHITKQMTFLQAQSTLDQSLFNIKIFQKSSSAATQPQSLSAATQPQG